MIEVDPVAVVRESWVRRWGVTPVMRVWTAGLKWLERQDWDEGATLMVFGALIGVASGLAVVVFYKMIDVSYFTFITWPEQHFVLFRVAWHRAVFTALGVWAAWWVVRRSRVPDGQNVPDVQLAVAKRDGVIPGRPVIVRTIASALTLGSGGSAGSEGPVAVLGAGLGSLLSGSLKLQPRYRKILVGCGAAAGIAAAFNAPFAGAFFALEEVLGSFSIGAFSPVVIASVVGALTVRSVLGEHPAFHIPGAGDTHPLANAFLYPILGLVCGLASALYARMYLGAPKFVRNVHQRLGGPEWTVPVAGGAITGVIVALTGGLIGGNGHLAIPSQIFGGLAWYILVGMAVAKMVTTALTLASGGSGGVFTPTLFIGAALGGGMGRLAAIVVPGNVVAAHAWALVGMAGLVAGATRAPLTAIFMVFEMTNDSSYIVPLMIVAVIAFVTAKRFAPHGLYDGWLAARGEHLWHGADQAVMDRLIVGDVLERDVERVGPSAGLSELLAVAARTPHGVIPVVEGDGTLVGVIGHHMLREAAARRSDVASLVVAADLIDAGEETNDALVPNQSLRSALSVMNAKALDALPVTQVVDGETRFLGLLSRADVLNAYERELAHSV